MASGWYAAFKDIPWSKALSVAPAIAERGRKLWGRAQPRAASVPPLSAAGAEALPALEVRCSTLESRIAQLDEEMVSSFEVVQAIAEQHSELVRAVDILLERTRVLLRACILLGAALVALLVLVLFLRA